MENFSNPIIVPSNLPEIDATSFNPLDKKQLIIVLIRIAIFTVLLVSAAIAILLLSDGSIPTMIFATVASVVTLFLISLVVHTLLAFPKKGYLVRENDISFHRGLITYKLTTVPYNRIQHVEVNQGVIGKLFKLSTLKLFTAGGNSSDLSIPGLPEDVAKSIKTYLSEKINAQKHD